MPVTLKNMPTGLKKLLPEGYSPKSADMVVLDRKGLDAAEKSAGEAADPIKLLHAYNKALGTETITIKLDELAPTVAKKAQKLAGKGGDSFTGADVLKALESPSKLTKGLQSVLPQLATLLHDKMGHEEMMKGTLSQGLPMTRASDTELSQWFAAAVADLREGAGKKKVNVNGAAKLIKITKQVLLNRGGGIITRAFFDGAVQELHQKPGFSDAALKKLNEFRVQTQPGRTSHKRTDKGALVKIDYAQRKKAERKLLNPTQTKAVDVCTKTAKGKVAQARKNVLEAAKAWGFSEADLDNVILYVQRYAPVTIQFNPDKKLSDGTSVVDSFLGEAFYKNQFQTKISSGSHGPYAGSSRDGWEKKCFAEAYHGHELIPEERPKYGGLSGLNSPKGNGGSWYGKCFFELRQDVKFRTTFTPRNSSGCNHDDVTTIDTVEVLLDQIRGKDSQYLKHMFEVARGDKVSIDKHYSGSYIEAQIHGDVELARDVDFLVIDKNFVTTPYGQKLLKLAEQIGATVKYTDQSKFYLHEPES